jgi:hypothetical protein
MVCTIRTPITPGRALPTISKSRITAVALISNQN